MKPRLRHYVSQITTEQDDKAAGLLHKQGKLEALIRLLDGVNSWAQLGGR